VLQALSSQSKPSTGMKYFILKGIRDDEQTKSEGHVFDGNFVEEGFEVLVKEGGMFHHGGVAAFVDENESGIRQEFMKFIGNESGGDLIIFTPDEQHGFADLAEVVPQVMPYGRFSGSDYADGLIAIVDGIEYFIDEVFRGDFRAKERTLGFFADKFLVAPFGEAGSHSAFKETGASGQDDGVYFLRMMQYKQQGNMSAK